jgi:predicted outer membrane protein
MIKSFLPAVAVLLAFSAALPAQTNTGDRAQQPSTQPATASKPVDGERSIDECVARCLALCNGSEIALAEFAKDRVRDQRVKDFVAMLHTEHGKCQSKLAKLNPQYSQIATEVLTTAQATPENQRNDRTNTSGRNDGNQAQPTAQASRPASDRPDNVSKSASVDPMFEIEKATAANCLRMTMAELESQPAEKFDKAFVGSQLGGHIHMIAKLEAVQPHVSSEMRPMIDECLESARRHMDEARKLCMALEQDSASSEKPSR